MHLFASALFVKYPIRNVGHRGDDTHVKLAVEALLDNLHVQQAQESTSESESQCHRRLGLEGQRSIVQLEFFERGTQVFVVLGFDGIDTGKHHGLHLLESIDGLVARACNVGDGIAHLHLLRGLDARDDVAHIARAKFVAGHHVHLQHTYFVRVILFTRVEELYLISLAEHTVRNLEIGNNSTERIEYRVEDERLQGSLLVAHRVRHTLHDGLQDFLHTHARLSRCADNLFALASEQVHDFVLHLVGHGTVHVTLVHHGDDFQVVLQRHVEVAEGLSLHTLRRIHNEQRPLASGNRARYLVGEVHVSRSVNQVQDVFLPLVGIFHLYGMALDGDASLLLQVHIVEHLSLSHLDGFRIFEQTVGQGRFSMVDVCDDAEVSYIFH